MIMKKEDEDRLTLDDIVQIFSSPRLGPYKQIDKTDVDVILQCYNLNSRAVGLLCRYVELFEVSLRNRMNVAFSEILGSGWLLSHANLRAREIDAINKVVQRVRDDARKPNLTVTHQKVLSELPLGFWFKMIDRENEERLLKPTVKKIFPHAKGKELAIRNRRKDFFKILRLRNRMYHHESIVTKNYFEESVRALIGMIKLIEPRLLSCFTDSKVHLKELEDIVDTVVEIIKVRT
jgi:hypothetical protein